MEAAVLRDLVARPFVATKVVTEVTTRLYGQARWPNGLAVSGTPFQALSSVVFEDHKCSLDRAADGCSLLAACPGTHTVVILRYESCAIHSRRTV